MKVMVDDFAFEPIRAHETDAGLDLRTPHSVCVRAGQAATIHTGVHVEIPHGYFGSIQSKSGLLFNHDLFTFGTIDEGYTGQIRVRIFNFSTEDYTFLPGDKVAQLVVIPVNYVVPEIVFNIDGGERGDSGFGSTGR